MEKYTQFIKTNKNKILEYYKKLYEIKKSIGLPVSECDITKLAICETPHLMIHNTYCKSRRDERIIRI